MIPECHSPRMTYNPGVATQAPRGKRIRQAKPINQRQWMAIGLPNVGIGERLTVSLPMVRTQVSRLLAKLQGRDRAQLVVAACESGFAARQHAEES
jgi:ATP/maltotriose-dependent transcriptional regulator MalT